MNDLEKLLGEAPRDEATPGLDDRVERLVREAERRGRKRHPRRIPLWAGATACLVGAVFGYLAHPIVNPPPRSPSGQSTSGRHPAAPSTTSPAGAEPAVQFYIEPRDALPRVLDAREETGRPGFFERERGEVKVIFKG